MNDHDVLIITVPRGTDIAPIEAAAAAIALRDGLLVQRPGPLDFCLQRLHRRANVVSLFGSVAGALRRFRSTTPPQTAA